VTCVRCGAAGHDQHHPTWRGSDGRYVDPAFTVPLCHDCHELTGDDTRTAGLAGSAATSVLESLELSLRRLAVFLARFDAGPCAPLTLGFARWCLTRADELSREIGRLDRSLPAWRIAGSADG
jgi:hypothetical protein